jgi:hypothetical protein
LGGLPELEGHLPEPLELELGLEPLDELELGLELPPFLFFA